MAKTIQQRTGRAEIKRQGHTESSKGSFGTGSRLRNRYNGESTNQKR